MIRINADAVEIPLAIVKTKYVRHCEFVASKETVLNASKNVQETVAFYIWTRNYKERARVSFASQSSKKNLQIHRPFLGDDTFYV